MPDEIVLVEVRGLAELGRALDNLPAQLSTRLMRGALHAAGDVMAAEAEITAPMRTGALRADIISQVHVSSDLSVNQVKVGPGYDRSHLRTLKRTGKLQTSSSPGVYGAFVELGTRRMHPRPWLLPAFESSKQSALDTFVEYIRAGLAAVAAAARSLTT